jgi:hypothetical protein
LINASLPKRLASNGHIVRQRLRRRRGVHGRSNLWISFILCPWETALSKIYPQKNKNERQMHSNFRNCVKKTW